MSIEWGQFREISDGKRLKALLRETITPDNYGNGAGQWSLTELINERSGPAMAARRIIEGVGDDGKREGRGPMRGPGGTELAIKLRVLSRQACTEAVDGKGVNWWDTTETEPENYNDEYCPAPDDKPLEGDVVWVKGNALEFDPATGERLIKKYRLALKSRMEAKLGRQIKPQLATHYHDKFTVGADGCITVPYLIAVQVLTQKGKHLVLPRFKNGAGGKPGQTKKERMITNWLFEEAFEQSKDKPHAKAAAVA